MYARRQIFKHPYIIARTNRKQKQSGCSGFACLTKKDYVISARVLDEEDLLQWEFCKTKKISLAPKRKMEKVKENVQISFI